MEPLDGEQATEALQPELITLPNDTLARGGNQGSQGSHSELQTESDSSSTTLDRKSESPEPPNLQLRSLIECLEEPMPFEAHIQRITVDFDSYQKAMSKIDRTPKMDYVNGEVVKYGYGGPLHVSMRECIREWNSSIPINEHYTLTENWRKTIYSYTGEESWSPDLVWFLDYAREGQRTPWKMLEKAETEEEKEMEEYERYWISCAANIGLEVGVANILWPHIEREHGIASAKHMLRECDDLLFVLLVDLKEKTPWEFPGSGHNTWSPVRVRNFIMADWVAGLDKMDFKLHEPWVHTHDTVYGEQKKATWWNGLGTAAVAAYGRRWNTEWMDFTSPEGKGQARTVPLNKFLRDPRGPIQTEACLGIGDAKTTQRIKKAVLGHIINRILIWTRDYLPLQREKQVKVANR